MKPKKYLNHLSLKSEAVGNERRYETLKEIMKNGTFLPKTVNYKDIDESFKDWVVNSLKISYNDKILPTMSLFSNQRFTEYSQTWEYTDENKNLILNFKTITRENNPEYGNIQGGLWNIPGDRFYLMKKQIVLDDNGSESFLVLKMRQPMAIDFRYKVSIFTTNLEPINDFNLLVNSRFRARQDYIFPNGHAMPMTLEEISDKSSYEIEDRQFYSQSFDIKVMGYVITENDYRVEEQPLKIGAKFSNTLVKKKADIEVEEYENPCNKPESEDKFYNKRVNITIRFPNCIRSVEFTADESFISDGMDLDGAKSYKMTVNGEELNSNALPSFRDGDEIRIDLIGPCIGREALLKFYGVNPDIGYSTEKNLPELEKDTTQYDEEIEINA